MGGFSPPDRTVVQWTDFRDDASVRTSFLLHKETMKENYSLHKIARQLEDMQEEEAKRKRGGEDPGGPGRTCGQDRRNAAGRQQPGLRLI